MIWSLKPTQESWSSLRCREKPLSSTTSSFGSSITILWLKSTDSTKTSLKGFRTRCTRSENHSWTPTKLQPKVKRRLCTFPSQSPEGPRMMRRDTKWRLAGEALRQKMKAEGLCNVACQKYVDDSTITSHRIRHLLHPSRPCHRLGTQEAQTARIVPVLHSYPAFY